MTYKYFYPFLQGAMKAIHMLAMFPELELAVEEKSQLLIVNKIETELDAFCKDLYIWIKCYDKNEKIINETFFYNKESSKDIKIIVPPEMESFFEVQVGDVVTDYDIIGEVSTHEDEGCVDVYIGDRHCEEVDSLEDLDVQILKRRGIQVFMPERVGE